MGTLLARESGKKKSFDDAAFEMTQRIKGFGSKLDYPNCPEPMKWKERTYSLKASSEFHKCTPPPPPGTHDPL